MNYLDTIKSNRSRWLKAAEELRPELFGREVFAKRLIGLERDKSCFQGIRVTDLGPAEKAYELTGKRDLDFSVDFGEYCVGHVSFDIEVDGIPDSPLRLQIVLGEVPSELTEDFSQYQGNLSRGWLQEEILMLDHPGGEVLLPRRYAFRYVRIRYNYGSAYKVRIKNVRCHAVTSADVSAPQALSPHVPECLCEIDRISLNTLKNCMQTVFEDGPKRDRRLWLGDLRLQALVNYHSFQNYDLPKRCLYLFAGLAQDDGLISACIYESPQPRTGESFIYDYAALFVPTLLEYAQASGDWETANELWPVAVRQMQIVTQDIDPAGLFQDSGKWWLFIDWATGLDKQAAEQGLIIYCLKKLCELGKTLGRENEIPHFKSLAEKMSQAAMSQLYNDKRSLFESGPSRQISWASQAWLIIAGLLSPQQAAKTLAAAEAEPHAIKPAGPYIYHYVVEAMILAGMETQAYALLEKFWGAMANLGADNFWEVFDPNDQFHSPYKSHLINSYCHAWSCTPAYFIRTQSSQMTKLTGKNLELTPIS